VATISSLVDKVRVELGDIGKSFVSQFVADGSTNRFQLHYFPLDDANNIFVYQNGVEQVDAVVESSTGVLVLPSVPANGDQISVSGNYYRYFTTSELSSLVTSAVEQHSANHTDSLGRKITVDTLPLIEEYPVAVYAVTLALYTLATDAAFDIDIQAPDGVTIPRAERYRQLMEMIQTRQAQYKDLCVQLGVGLYRIDVFTLRRISKATGRYIPVYLPQEVDDRSYPQRVDDQLPTYGNRPAPWTTEAGDLTAYQGTAFTTTLTATGDLTDHTLACRLLNQRGSVLVVQDFTMTNFVGPVDTTVGGVTTRSYTIQASLTADQTLRLAERTYWSLVKVGLNPVLTMSAGQTYATGALSILLHDVPQTNVVGLTLYGTNVNSVIVSQSGALLTLATPTTGTVTSGDTLTLNSTNLTEIGGGNFFTARSSTVVI